MNIVKVLFDWKNCISFSLKENSRVREDKCVLCHHTDRLLGVSVLPVRRLVNIAFLLRSHRFILDVTLVHVF